ncbi:ubiquitin-like small modifier protein 1 [Thermococcus thioreducens]|uniref:Molybdopterin converting factor n=1 Tax=Thermococcus thioreducens TaxID=277988 RepID=A0A0Q2M300_9EURY|nr:ubiquitin-like small modifier protein 1 [Thermococcus thioreducens]ASJ12586.1 molybdopterin synthase sulfur carrier subunit [Thermococcus thioreducens]KQH82417.1 molybdopterin converting factor [Thermococcus thioreducens]SEV88282.1 molybdopterin synthase sulfur carrier subunit [Thermococcus thioreducens]
MRVKFYATFRELMGTKEVEVHGVKTVRELIEYLAEHYSPEIRKQLLETERVAEGKPVDGMILVNGHNVLHLKGLDTELEEDDEVHIFPPAGGG